MLSISVAASLALLAAIWWSGHVPHQAAVSDVSLPEGAEHTPVLDGSGSEGLTPSVAPVLPTPEDKNPNTFAAPPLTQPEGWTDTTTASGLNPGPMDTSLSIEDTLKALKTEFSETSAAEVAARKSDASEGNAEAALWLAMLFEECAGAAPTYDLLDRRLNQVEQQVKNIYESNPEADLGDWPDRATREAIDKFEMCSDIPGKPDLVLESFNYFGLAADLGHPTAQRAYHAHGFNLLMNNGRFERGVLGFEQPMLIEEFKSRAERYATTLWRSGTPHALTLLARMYYQGDVYPRDLVMTYAYGQAATLEGSAGILQAGSQWKEITRFLMTQEQIADAEELAHDLLRQHREQGRR
ncbi:MAG: hypothetical protein AAF358_04400 [Pseudomonadota bacterium]